MAELKEPWDTEFPGFAAGQGPCCRRERVTIMIMGRFGQIQPTLTHDHEPARGEGRFLIPGIGFSEGARQPRRVDPERLVHQGDNEHVGPTMLTGRC